MRPRSHRLTRARHVGVGAKRPPRGGVTGARVCLANPKAKGAL
jgi:hypothetical protein